VLTVVAIYLIRKKLSTSNKLKFSKGLDKSPTDQENDNTELESKNEIRQPTQGEFNLDDPNELKYLSIHLLAKQQKQPEFGLLETKIIANGLTYQDSKKVFLKVDSNNIVLFYIVNGEGNGVLNQESNISLVTFVLPLQGQRNILKIFEDMIALARNIASSFEMKLLDDNFNSMSDQTITNYKERAAEIDINYGNNVARRRIK
jgi:FtsZ-interacting cell division protein ZipA